jgi:hypothetical protein
MNTIKIKNTTKDNIYINLQSTSKNSIPKFYRGIASILLFCELLTSCVGNQPIFPNIASSEVRPSTCDEQFAIQTQHQGYKSTQSDTNVTFVTTTIDGTTTITFYCTPKGLQATYQNKAMPEALPIQSTPRIIQTNGVSKSFSEINSANVDLALLTKEGKWRIDDSNGGLYYLGMRGSGGMQHKNLRQTSGKRLNPIREESPEFADHTPPRPPKLDHNIYTSNYIVAQNKRLYECMRKLEGEVLGRAEMETYLVYIAISSLTTKHQELVHRCQELQETKESLLALESSKSFALNLRRINADKDMQQYEKALPIWRLFLGVHSPPQDLALAKIVITDLIFELRKAIDVYEIIKKALESPACAAQSQNIVEYPRISELVQLQQKQIQTQDTISKEEQKLEKSYTQILTLQLQKRALEKRLDVVDQRNLRRTIASSAQPILTELKTQRDAAKLEKDKVESMYTNNDEGLRERIFEDFLNLHAEKAEKKALLKKRTLDSEITSLPKSEIVEKNGQVMPSYFALQLPEPSASSTSASSNTSGRSASASSSPAEVPNPEKDRGLESLKFISIQEPISVFPYPARHSGAEFPEESNHQALGEKSCEDFVRLNEKQAVLIAAQESINTQEPMSEFSHSERHSGAELPEESENALLNGKAQNNLEDNFFQNLDPTYANHLLIERINALKCEVVKAKDKKFLLDIALTALTEANTKLLASYEQLNKEHEGLFSVEAQATREQLFCAKEQTLKKGNYAELALWNLFFESYPTLPGLPSLRDLVFKYKEAIQVYAGVKKGLTGSSINNLSSIVSLVPILEKALEKATSNLLLMNERQQTISNELKIQSTAILALYVEIGNLTQALDEANDHVSSPEKKTQAAVISTSSCLESPTIEQKREIANITTQLERDIKEKASIYQMYMEDEPDLAETIKSNFQDIDFFLLHQEIQQLREQLKQR